MRVELTKAWMKNPVPAEDLAPILGMHYREFIQIMSGEREPSEGCKQNISKLFDEPVEKLFPSNGYGGE